MRAHCAKSWWPAYSRPSPLMREGRREAGDRDGLRWSNPVMPARCECGHVGRPDDYVATIRAEGLRRIGMGSPWVGCGARRRGAVLLFPEEGAPSTGACRRPVFAANLDSLQVWVVTRTG